MKSGLLLILLCFTFTTHAADLKPFKSDGCSIFPDGTFLHKNLWLSCCIEHDKLYWKGGTYLERELADKALKICVAQIGQPEIAELMMAGVRAGGSPYFPTEFRWGYGWPYLRGYKALTLNEQSEISLHLNWTPD